jgi:threonine/homoserine/homoserine lactone efflux protein
MPRDPLQDCDMSSDLLLALVSFAFVTSVTPGPNNLMLMASGANFGLRRTLPHMLGIPAGFVLLAGAAGLGLAGLLHTVPAALWALKAAAVGYMLWLAAKIARAGAPQQAGKDTGAGGTGPAARPMTLVQAAAFQWVNPKAWAMALGAVTVYAPQGDAAQIGLVALVFSLVNLPTITLWAWAGEGLRGWLADPRRLRAFNLTMAALLVASLWPVVKL